MNFAWISLLTLTCVIPNMVSMHCSIPNYITEYLKNNAILRINIKGFV
jgi:hypothetical protein